MELREFIKNSLLDILGGIQDAANAVHQNGGLGAVNPVDKAQIFKTQKVEFDIAVTASNEQAKGAEGGIKVYGLTLGANGKQSEADSSVSRLKFEIPIALPAQVIEEPPVIPQLEGDTPTPAPSPAS